MAKRLVNISEQSSFVSGWSVQRRTSLMPKNVAKRVFVAFQPTAEVWLRMP